MPFSYFFWLPEKCIEKVRSGYRLETIIPDPFQHNKFQICMLILIQNSEEKLLFSGQKKDKFCSSQFSVSCSWDKFPVVVVVLGEQMNPQKSWY
jgi:hypothetical protein